MHDTISKSSIFFAYNYRSKLQLISHVHKSRNKHQIKFKQSQNTRKNHKPHENLELKSKMKLKLKLKLTIKSHMYRCNLKQQIGFRSSKTPAIELTEIEESMFSKEDEVADGRRCCSRTLCLSIALSIFLVRENNNCWFCVWIC